MFNWKNWLHGLGAAAVGGGVTAAAQATQNGASLKATGLTAAAGAIVTVLGYFLQSPIFKSVNAPTPKP